MSYRFMRLLVMFDLPTITPEDKREYRRFRKFLIRNGFVKMQESIYTKIIMSSTIEHAYINLIKKNRPAEGLVQLLSITEKQFAKMQYITGVSSSDVINTDERLVVL